MNKWLQSNRVKNLRDLNTFHTHCSAYYKTALLNSHCHILHFIIHKTFFFVIFSNVIGLIPRTSFHKVLTLSSSLLLRMPLSYLVMILSSINNEVLTCGIFQLGIFKHSTTFLAELFDAFCWHKIQNKHIFAKNQYIIIIIYLHWYTAILIECQRSRNCQEILQFIPNSTVHTIQ